MTIYWLNSPECQNAARTGGKAANLSRLAAIFPVPPGFCLTAGASKMTPALYAEVAEAYRQLGERCGMENPPVAVRSSAIDEDGQQTSFAGQHETYLNMRGVEAVTAAVQRCWASAHNERARFYRRQWGLLPKKSGLAVLVQLLVFADVCTVVFSADPRTGQRDRVVINATWGLGESLVGGLVTPDLYTVRKTTLEIVSRQIAAKTCMTITDTAGTHEVNVPHCLQSEPALTDAQVRELAVLARRLEAKWGWPVDLECAYQNDRLYLLQCRPITTLAPAPRRITPAQPHGRAPMPAVAQA